MSAILLLCFLLNLVACGKGTIPEEDELTIVTTIFPPYDFARQISRGAENVNLKMLLPPGSESHDYEPTINDIALVGRADLIICVGGETDAWIDEVISSTDSKAKVLRLCDMVELLEEDESVLVTEEEHHHEHSHEHDDECVFDEHVWTSPENSAIITKAIAEEMCCLSEENASLFQSNASSYAEELRKVQSEMNALANGAEDKILLFADRFPFRYLAESLDMTCRSAFSGCASDSEASLEAVYRLTELATETNATVIFTCEFSSRNAAEIISREAGCKILELHSCHNVSKKDFDDGVTVLDLMKRNLQYLNEAIS